ncbi:MAG: hypothetical protein ACP5XB_32455 [Isosphaeraceae bacterium]
MTTDLIHDRGRGPELVGTRITIYNLLPHFLDPTATEAYICQLYDLSPEQVSAARAYVLNHPDTVLARHLAIEARMAEGNPPEVIEQAKRLHATFLRFRDRVLKQQQGSGAEDVSPGNGSDPGQTGPSRGMTFREWMAAHDVSTGQGS